MMLIIFTIVDWPVPSLFRSPIITNNRTCDLQMEILQWLPSFNQGLQFNSWYEIKHVSEGNDDVMLRAFHLEQKRESRYM